MRVLSSICAVAIIAAAALLAVPEADAQRGRNNNQGVVAIDYQRVLTESVIGRDLQAKLNDVRTQIGGEVQALAPEAQSIEAEARRLQQSLRNQSQQQLAQNAEVQALAQRQQQLQQRQQSLQGDYECTQLIALRDLRLQIMPVVRTIMEDRNAGIAVDSSQALEVNPGVDITTTVIQQLDQNAGTRSASVSRRPVAECVGQQQQAAAQ
jgi:Skp family chaperone for outer membrane proteins